MNGPNAVIAWVGITIHHERPARSLASTSRLATAKQRPWRSTTYRPTGPSGAKSFNGTWRIKRRDRKAHAKKSSSIRRTWVWRSDRLAPRAPRPCEGESRSLERLGPQTRGVAHSRGHPFDATDIASPGLSGTSRNTASETRKDATNAAAVCAGRRVGASGFRCESDLLHQRAPALGLCTLRLRHLLRR